MIYKYKNEYYIKLSGYLIEVIPFINNGEVDFKTTENKIEITSDLLYKSIKIEDIKKELESGKKDIPPKVSERTHTKFKFDYKD